MLFSWLSRYCPLEHYSEPVIILGLNIQIKLIWLSRALTLASLWAARTLVPQVNLLLKVYLGRGHHQWWGDFSAAQFDCPSLLWRREGFTITSKELPAESLPPGVCFGNKYVFNLKRILPSSAQRNLDGTKQLTRTHSHSQRHCCSLPFTSLQSSFMQCWPSWTNFGWKTHPFAEVGGLSALHIAALPAAHLTKCWGTCSSRMAGKCRD